MIYVSKIWTPVTAPILFHDLRIWDSHLSGSILRDGQLLLRGLPVNGGRHLACTASGSETRKLASRLHKRPLKSKTCLVSGFLFGYGSIPIDTFFSGMNIHLPAILGFTRYQGFDPSPFEWYGRYVCLYRWYGCLRYANGEVWPYQATLWHSSTGLILVINIYIYIMIWYIYGGFLKWGYPKMEGLQWKILLKWMIWGYPPVQESSIL